MAGKGIYVLAGAAVALGIAAYMTGDGGKNRVNAMVGEKIVGSFDIEKVDKIEIGDKVTLAAGEGGWKIETMQGYPADRSKIADSLLKLQELKVGQVVTGKKIARPTPVTVRDASGNVLASVVLGERHEKWSYGRYVEYKGAAVLTGEGLDEFGDDPKRWCDTKIIDEPWVSFSSLADADVDDAVTGFSTGVVAKVTIAGDTNRTVTVGNAAPGGSGRYLKIDGQKWTFVVPSYSVEKLLPKEEPAPSAEDPAPDSGTAVVPAADVEPAPSAEESAPDSGTAVIPAANVESAPVAE